MRWQFWWAALWAAVAQGKIATPGDLRALWMDCLTTFGKSTDARRKNMADKIDVLHQYVQDHAAQIVVQTRFALHWLNSETTYAFTL
jgi:hypothetical protein